MKTLYLDLSMGAAGDMLAAALLEVHPDREDFLRRFRALGLSGVTVEAQRAEKCGVTGTHFAVYCGGAEEDELFHSLPQHHHHRGIHEIEDVVFSLPLETGVKLAVLDVFHSLAEAESRVHGVSVSDIHFHEVGTLDAVADITAVCMLMHDLAPDEVIASPVHVGSGTVKCAHGVLPVPAPAAAELLRGIPICSGEIRGELCTPTGAALVKHYVNRFGPLPAMAVTAIGYGMGKKDFLQANCIRALLGEREADSGDVTELGCNIDDMTGEALGYATERIYAAGAVEVFTVPVYMKKNRPGVLLKVICPVSARDAVVQAIFRHTSTIGIRETGVRRHVLTRSVETVETPLGPVRRKVSEGFGTERRKWEYDDLARIAGERGVSLEEARRLIERK